MLNHNDDVCSLLYRLSYKSYRGFLQGRRQIQHDKFFESKGNYLSYY